MKKIIRRILREDQRERYLNKIGDIMKNDFPLFKNMELYGFYDQLSEDEINYVFSGVFGEPVSIHELTNRIYDDKNGNIIYSESPNGYWSKWEYNEDGRVIYYEDSTGYWYRKEYDENGKLIYKEFSDGYWKKWEHDENSNIIYYEKSNGYWWKKEYDENGNMLYYENSRGGIRDYR